MVTGTGLGTRRQMRPMNAKPTSIIIQLAGSGTGCGGGSEAGTTCVITGGMINPPPGGGGGIPGKPVGGGDSAAGGSVVTTLKSGVPGAATAATGGKGSSEGPTIAAKGLSGTDLRIFGSARSWGAISRLCLRFASAPSARSPGDLPSSMSATVCTPFIPR